MPAITKGDLLRYYARSPLHPPAVAESPARHEAVSERRGRPGLLPAAVARRAAAGGRAHRNARGSADPISEPDAKTARRRIADALLYMTQIAAISQDPWSRACSRRSTRTTSRSIWIRPAPRRSRTCLDVAGGGSETSCPARRAGVPEDVGLQRAAHLIPLRRDIVRIGDAVLPDRGDDRRDAPPQNRDLERTVRRRPRGTVYVDFLQHILARRWRRRTARAPATMRGRDTVTWKEVMATWTRARSRSAPRRLIP